ncbi:MAG TPA: hypothetical protein VGJ05_21015 [Fimbriiglobus sp.]|jgi:hypothetical protein
MRSRLLAWVAASILTAPAFAYDGPESESFETADGVKLQGIFYKANPAKSKNNSCVLLIHAFKAAKPGKGLDDLAKTLSKEGYNVLEFTQRGHGATPTDVDPDFWRFKFNVDCVSGSGRNPPKSSITLKDFRNEREYYPYLVNDVMAARVLLDRKNDNGQVNTSSVYLVGVGDAVNLGIFYATVEWYREAKKPNLPPAFEPKIIDPRRLLQDTEVAGKDIAGAVWISPAKLPAMNDSAVKAFLSRYAVRLREQTPMLFINDEKDRKGRAASNYYFNEVLIANPRSGTRLAKLQQTFHRELKPSGRTKPLVGVDLIGDKTGLEEMVIKFLNKVHEERKDIPPIPTRGYTKPLLVNPPAFGVGGGN